MLPNGYLLLDPVGLEDQGTYTCVATNRYGSDSSSGQLRVMGQSLALGPQHSSPDWIQTAIRTLLIAMRRIG